MKGQLWTDLDRFLYELHRDRQFEIFTCSDQKEHTSPVCYVAFQCDGDNLEFNATLEKINDQGKGIWFTANSMKNGKRKIEFITSYNAIALDLDCGKEGQNREDIEKSKKKNLSLLLNLQLIPTVIVETKNGLQPYWFLLPDEVTDNETHNSIQRMMQTKLRADPNAIGGERLYRLPGYYHCKDINDKFLCKIVHQNYSKRYTLIELVHKFGGQRKLRDLRKKSAGKKYHSKPITLAEFKHPGDVSDIAIGCRAVQAIELDKSPSHIARLALLTIYANLGKAGIEYFRKIAMGWNDYNEDMTEYMIGHAVKQGYKPMTCQYLMENGICPGKCANIMDKHSPIAFYYHPMPSLPCRFENRTLIDVDAIPVQSYHVQIQERLKKTFINNYHQTISNSHNEIFLRAASVMSFRPPDEKPIVISFIPGGGKTTFIVQYLRFMTSYDAGFGAVLVVERQESIKEIAREINLRWFCGTDSFQYEIETAYPMLGYHANDCIKRYKTYKPSQCKTCDVRYDECRVKYNFTRQKHFPIVVISHARLFEMSDRDDALDSLRHWEEWIQIGPDQYEKRKHQRRLLILDEKPKLIDNVSTDNTMWDNLLSDASLYTPSQYAEVEAAVAKVRNQYYKPDEYDIVAPIDEKFHWSKDFIEAWKDDYLGDNPEYPELLKRIISEGGLYNRNDNAISLTHYNNTYWGDYNAVIFDGSAMTDPDYRSDRFIFWNVPHLRPYNNLILNVCMEQNLSKAYYQEHPGFIEKFCRDINDIADDDMTYVVAYKGFEEEFHSRLKDNNKIKLEHWGNTKGRNDLAECKNIVCAGLLHKGEPYYHSKDIAINGARANDRSFNCVTTGKVRRFVDLDTESTKVYEFLTELIQDIFRTALRNHYQDNEINVYLCTRDVNLVNLLSAFFNGCVVNRDWKPSALHGSRDTFREFASTKRDEHRTNAKLIRAYLDEGNSLTTDDIVDVIGISIDDAGKILRRIKG